MHKTMRCCRPEPHFRLHWFHRVTDHLQGEEGLVILKIFKVFFGEEWTTFHVMFGWC